MSVADGRPRIYVAGRMRGVRLYNFPVFDMARDALLAKGWDVVSPADIDRAHGFDPKTLPADFDWDGLPEGLDYESVMLRDFEALETCHAIFLLPDWEESSGANRELAEASRLGLRVFSAYECIPDASAMCPVRAAAAETAGEIRVTDADTGGQKGAKQERFEMLPTEPIEELARHYAVGAKKYSAHNWRKGYAWSLSFAACQRHLWAFWRGEDMDSETGSKHVIAAAFHCLALAEFMDTMRCKDDRYVRKAVGPTA